MLKWPDSDTIDKAVRHWAKAEVERHPDARLLGYFGSYARGNWGVGSDLDLIAVVSDSTEPFERRNLSWDLNALPVPADMLIYTVKEWERLKQSGSRLYRTVIREAIWVYDKAC